MARLDPGLTQRVSQAADAMLAGPSGVNPAVRTMGQMVKSALDDPNMSPERLYELRKVLTGGYTPGTELGAAIKSAARERSILIGAIDEALDGASNGVWSKYMDAYQKASAPITSMKAVQKVRERFVNVPGEIPSQLGERPAPEFFGRAVKKEGAKLFGSTWKDRLTPGDREVLDTITRDLQRQAEVMRPRGVIGSPTAPLGQAAATAENIGATLLGEGISQAIPGGRFVTGAIAGARQGMENARNRALAEILQDPEKLSDLILKARRAERILGATSQASRPARAIGDPWE
jgi:hypothetical protein